MTLNPEELRTLTSKARRTDQEHWLSLQGIPYRKDGERLIVGRTIAEAFERRDMERKVRAAYKVRLEIIKAAPRVQGAKRRAAELRAMPAWADQEAIRAVYIEADRLSQKTGIKHHVDHVIPLRGELVSGLHVAENLRPIPWRENLRKNNRYEIC